LLKYKNKTISKNYVGSKKSANLKLSSLRSPGRITKEAVPQLHSNVIPDANLTAQKKDKFNYKLYINNSIDLLNMLKNII